MAKALRVGRLVLVALFSGPTASGEEGGTEIPFVGPPKPPPPLVIKKYAGDLFSLDPFVLHIPLDDDGDGLADTVAMPLLRNFEDPAFFHLDKNGESILFRVRGGDPRLAGESFPRSELRERAKQGEGPASWSANDGLVHSLSISLAFRRVPPSTPVVALSLHGETGEVLAVRHQTGKVVLSRAGLDPLILAESYLPGSPLELHLVLSNGKSKALAGSASLGEWPVSAGGLHFRAGCILEFQRDSEAEPPTVGEVSITKLYLTHKSR